MLLSDKFTLVCQSDATTRKKDNIVIIQSLINSKVVFSEATCDPNVCCVPVRERVQNADKHDVGTIVTRMWINTTQS